MIFIIDFGGQTAHLIKRRIQELGREAHFAAPEEALPFILQHHAGKHPKQQPIEGIILSGGPMSVYETNAPTIDKKIFELGIPILGICYGMQLNSYLLGGKVVSGRKEYGPAKLRITNHTSPMTKSLPQDAFTIWMSHGDEVLSMPEGYAILGSTETVPYGFVANEEKNIYGIQFHPEVEHTEYGTQILKNFVEICTHHQEKTGSGRIALHANLVHNTDEHALINKIKQTVGKAHVIGAISGGVDSTVAGTLVAKAIGKQFTPIFVDNGLMRDDAVVTVKEAFETFGITPIVVHVQEEMLRRLKGITDSEEKRKIIGNFYIEVFEQEMEKLLQKDHDVQFLLQGTIYSDVIESQGTKYASKIKSHHNVGGLPENMKLQLLEPLRDLYKDEVRELGRKIGLPESFVMKQPFPGPGFAVRIRDEVTHERLAQEKQADKIVLEELKKAGILEKIFISFPVMTGAYSTAVKGDGKFFGEVVALRVIESNDIMTATWSRLPYDVLQVISSRIVNEVPHISRVVYDITTKPPSTMEWE
jgi:GMP synthase (glutamine-hydrolysing)